MFGTDVVDQFIAIPRCGVVVNFLGEIKPHTHLSFNEEGIPYSSILERRHVDDQISKQRKGRTGGTNAGWYIKLRECEAVFSHGLDAHTLVEAVIRSEIFRLLSAKCSKEKSCQIFIVLILHIRSSARMWGTS